jgi:hypothetical protein
MKDAEPQKPIDPRSWTGDVDADIAQGVAERKRRQEAFARHMDRWPGFYGLVILAFGAGGFAAALQEWSRGERWETLIVIIGALLFTIMGIVLLAHSIARARAWLRR